MDARTAPHPLTREGGYSQLGIHLNTTSALGVVGKNNGAASHDPLAEKWAFEAPLQLSSRARDTCIPNFCNAEKC